MPVQNNVAVHASGGPMGTPSSTGTQLGATKLNSRPSKPQPSHTAKTTVHWYPVRSHIRRRPAVSDMDVDSTRWAGRPAWPVVAVVALLLTFIGSSAGAQESDLDALMAQVLERRNETWKALHDYVLDEREAFALVGPSDLRLFGSERTYTWYVRDGVLVRSPVRANGVAVAEADRREYEQKWLNEEQSRAERAARREKDDPPQATAAPGDAPAEIVAKNLEPRFVSEANFLRFRFERGRYFLVGREVLDGRPVLKVEYYPTKLFQDQGRDRGVDERRRARDDARKFEEEIDRKFNKVSLVTLWIDPAEQQIVRYDFENLGLDFLPGRWLVRVGETTASMTMGRYFDGVWLPKSIVMKGDLQVAVGAFDIDYHREFLEYRKAETSARIRAYGDVK